MGINNIFSSIGLSKKSNRKAYVTISMVKGTPYYEPHSKHPYEDYLIVLPPKRMLKYKIKGVNPKNGRSKTIYGIILPSWKPFPTEIPGIEPPYVFTENMTPVSERQKSLLVRNGFRVPDGLSLEDAKVIISHFVSDTEKHPRRYIEPPLPDYIMEQAAEKLVLLPSFLSLKEANLFLAGKSWRCDF